jgi:glutamate-5-semialdehyde dehydrogenase
MTSYSSDGSIQAHLSKTPAADIPAVARAARHASRQLAKASADDRNRALSYIATAIRDNAASIIEANAVDLSNAEAKGMAPAMVDRLRLDGDRLDKVAMAVEEIAAMDEVVGDIERAYARPNGLEVSRVRIPLGVVAIIYESRPNVTTDAAALCIKSGNAVILRGGSEAFNSNQALGAAVAAGLEAAGLPAEVAQVVSTTDRDAVKQLLACDDDIDVVIPRGGEGLIRFVAETSRIPVLKHYKGVCHVYVHAAADTDMALSLCENSKAQRVSVCNSAETLLVDRAIAADFVPRLVARLSGIGVEIRGDEATVELGGDAVKPATDGDWSAEFLAMIVAVRVVDGIDVAIDHIERYGSNHTETIVTADSQAAEQFLHDCNSSTVLHNASTRFADGGQLGLGAEIGISTTKLHAYGPMGAEGLTTTKFVVRGQGQIRTT